jgi:hypothetical protein
MLIAWTLKMYADTSHTQTSYTTAGLKNIIVYIQEMSK